MNKRWEREKERVMGKIQLKYFVCTHGKDIKKSTSSFFAVKRGGIG
jgi:hypothetical protein